MKLFVPPIRLLVVACWCLSLAPLALADVESQLRNLIDSSDLRGTTVAAFVQDAKTGEVLADIDADRAMAPASNMKLLTTAAALVEFGPDFAFETTLLHLPPPEGGTTHRLAVVGSGDPAFGDPVLLARLEAEINANRPADQHVTLNPDVILDDWVEDTVAHLKEQGVSRVAELLIDDRIYDNEFVHPLWPRDQLNYYYCAQVSGLNFYNNIVDVTATPSRPGNAPLVRLYPMSPTIKTRNLATTGNSQGFWVDRDEATNDLVFRGTLRHSIKTPVPMTVHDPAMFFAELLRERLVKEGLAVDRIRRVDSQMPRLDGVVLERFRTMLPWIIDRTNQESHNLFAESLLKQLGYRLTGSPGSFENGSAALRQFLAKQLEGRVRTAGVQVSDGSGLSHTNRLSARVLGSLLTSMHRDEKLGKLYLQSLAEAGTNGTLKRRLGENLTGEVYAKTGYISRKVDDEFISASSLSGYLVLPAAGPDDKPRTISFSLLFNDFSPRLTNAQMKKLQDQMVRAIDQDLTRSLVNAAQ